MLRLSDSNPNKTSNLAHIMIQMVIVIHVEHIITYNKTFSFVLINIQLKCQVEYFYGVRRLVLGVQHIAVPCNYEFYNNCSYPLQFEWELIQKFPYGMI